MSGEGEKDNERFQPADLYKHIESWWGADFNDELIERMVSAPTKHQRAFVDSVEALIADFDNNLTVIPPGVLRPALRMKDMEIADHRRLEGLRLLLYAHEIVLDTEDFFADFFFDEATPWVRPLIRRSLGQIAKMRPFVEDGSIKFAPMRSMGLDPEIAHELEKIRNFPEIIAVAEDINRGLVRDQFRRDPVETLRDIYSEHYAATSVVCRIAAMQLAHILARDRREQAIIHRLLQRPVIDNRQTLLQNLAAMNVPTMAGDINSLVALRKSQADFAEWRHRLGEALTYVGELAEDEESLSEAAAVVHAQLSDGLSQVNKAVKKSPALQAVKGGLSGFAISGISTMTTELLLGNPSVELVALASAVGASAGMVADSGLSYLRTLQARRRGRLIMDVSMLFDPQGPVDN